jgi:alpha-glucuronidase
MHLDGYSSVDVVPWEDASGGKAIQCTDKTACSAETTLEKASGVYSIAVQYFDFHQGASTYKVSVNGNIAGQWAADNTLPFNQIGGDTSTRYTLHDIRLKPGDVLKIEGQPNGNEPAPLDYVEISPETKASDSAAAVHP